jgi:exopolyphosphatase/guanosine-5'-triphosphate,3'-diphosphate pyrophosphatase
MPRYAAVDVGSNSVRLLVAETSPGGGAQTLAADRQVTRLGESVFRTGRIAADSLQFVCDNLARMAQTVAKHNVIGLRAVATSAVRDASNQEEFLEKTSAAMGAPVEIISGQEEARLIYLGVQARWPHADKRILIVDVGGGSAEVILGDNGALAEAYSRPLGAVRLTEAFLKHDPPTPLELHQLERYIEEKLAGPARKIGRAPLNRAVATSATAAAIVCAVNRVPRPRRDQADRMRASAAQIRRFYEDVRTRDLAARRKLVGVGPRRAELIVAGAAVFVKTLLLFQHSSLYYSAAGVRDGIIADLAARGVGGERTLLGREQRHIVEQMARRYGVQPQHARKVGALAHRLFEAFEPAHKLPAAFGKLLEAAAYLHDIGHFVSDVSHHKHSQYLVAHSDMPGFTDRERRIIATLCRYHRKTAPNPRHAPFVEFDPETQRAITLLTPLLRLADSLDRSHEQRIENVQVELRNGTAVVTLDANSEADLELWAAEKIADVFREAYDLPLVIARAKT